MPQPARVEGPRGRSSRRSAATAALVLEIATAAAGERELDHILATTLDRLRAVVRLTGGSIAIVEGDDLVVRAAVGPFADEALGQRLPRGRGRSWQVVLNRTSFVTGDLQAAGMVVRTSARAARAIRSWLGVPIVRRGEGIGLLEIDSTRRNAFGDRDHDLLDTVARALAGPIDLASRYAAERRAAILRDAFIGVISHELRTPITTIYGASTMLRRRGESLDPIARQQAIADIEAEADRLRRLIEDLLVMSRAEGGRVELAREPVLLGHVVRRACEAEAVVWPRHGFRSSIARNLPIVFAEETYVEQIVRNLLTNAAKYSPEGSEVRIVVEAADDPERGVRVRVLDDGIGIDTAEPDRLFDLFYRAPAATRLASGAGIGLFVCRELVAAMGGRIWAMGRPTGGAEFGFSLPAAESDGDVEPDASPR
ncbi:MAG TPA: ATP-binding protein [Candidatus Limnocylindrales bacterium]|nr:ATP-binding protein [Candidatus Limnocylindrales bacterium]